MSSETPAATPGHPEDDRQTLTLAASAAAADAAAHPLPATIGRYRVLRLLGEGGMGVVYEAEQDRPRRTVALKVIKAAWASPDLIRRFEQESQALGRLHHPGIAQIYEAASADTGFGFQPFFAMELIHGKPLGVYADAHRLDTRQRLALMIQVCDAVQHAHQRGIIHRDLKPGNILVDENGQPKILDFGLARVTDGDAQATRQTDMGQLLGTLAYMSPEQVLADPLAVDTRSDVYALGVILYELLARKLPYSLTRRLDEAVQTIQQHDPARLSSVARIYRGDIETIVAKALEKDRERRYASAADLAADIRRHLEDQPILATPPSATYQLNKFARRHKALVAGIAAVFVVLVAGILASTWEAFRAKQAQQAAVIERDNATSARKLTAEERDRANNERNRAVAAEAQAIEQETLAVGERNKALIAQRKADTEAATSRAISEFLQNDLLGQASSSAQARPGNKPDPDLKVRTALDRAAARIAGKFDSMPLVEASLRMTLGDTYRELGLFSEAERELEHAAALRRRELGADHPDTLDVLYVLGLNYQDEGKYAQAEVPLLQVLEVNRRRWGENHVKTIRSANSIGIVYVKEGKYVAAQNLFAQAVDAATRTLGEQNADTLNALNNLASTYFYLGNQEKAVEALSRVLEGQRRAEGEEHPATLNTMKNLAVLQTTMGHLDQAESLLNQVMEIQRRTMGAEHPDTLSSLNELALVYNRQGKFFASETVLKGLVETRQRLMGAEHPETLRAMDLLAVSYRGQSKYTDSERLSTLVLEARRRILGAKHPDTLSSLYNFSQLYQTQGKYREEEPLLAEAWEGSREALGREHPTTLSRMETMAAVSIILGKYDQAAKLYSEVLEIRRRILGREHIDTTGPMIGLGAALILHRDFREAEPLLREAAAIREKANFQGWSRLNAQGLLGATLAGQGKFAEAEPLLTSAVQDLLDHRREIPGLSLFYLDTVGDAVVRMYQEMGQPDRAAEWKRKLPAGSETR